MMLSELSFPIIDTNDIQDLKMESKVHSLAQPNQTKLDLNPTSEKFDPIKSLFEADDFTIRKQSMKKRNRKANNLTNMLSSNDLCEFRKQIWNKIAPQNN